MKLSVIIINYKSEPLMERCLHHLAFHGDYEIIVIDNENNPALMERISKFPRLKTIPFAGNLGFAGGNNRAIKQALGEYICTLNADAFLAKDYLDKCVDFLEKNPEYASVQGKLLKEDNNQIVDSLGNLLTRGRFPQNINHRERDTYENSREIFGVTAAAAVYRKIALEKVKEDDDYFDSDFFAYLEDVDLDWRLRMAGYKAYFLNTAVASHIRESSSNIMFRLRQGFINRMYLIIKDDSCLSVVVNLLLFWPIFIIYGNRKRNIGLIFKMFGKRRKIQKSRTVSHREVKLFIEKTPWKKMIFKLFQIN